MRKEDILSKGLYVHSQVEDLVSVKQYIVAKFKNKKALFLRFSNDREEIATAMTLRIRQYDVRGEFIGAETIEVKHLKIEPHTDFTVKNPMIIKDSCIDFRVDIINVAYGDYTYDVIDGEAHVRFAKQEAEVKKSINTNQLRLALDGKSQKVSVRSLKAPVLLILVCSVLLLSLLCFTIGQLALFMYTETCFTLDNFEYEFLTDNKDDGPIRLTAYNGFAINLIIPAEIEGYEIASVAKTAFSGTKLRSIVFEGNTTIENGAFEDCKVLHTVEIKNVETIGNKAFKGCKSLKKLTLGGSLKKIGEYAFKGCASLESVELGESLESIGQYAFEGCAKINELTVPASAHTIGQGIVAGCDVRALSVPFVGASADDLEALSYLYGVSNNSMVRSALVSVTVTNQTVIPDGAFENCAALCSIDFKLPVKSIGDNAFKGCKKIKTFEIDDTVEYIGKNAFYKCVSLDGIVIPDGIKRIEAGCFYSCESLSSIEIPDQVETIGKDAFKGCTSLKILTVPKTVTRLEEGAFADCTSLIEVTIPFIGYSSDEPASMRAVFGNAGAESVKAVNLTGSGTICDGAFENMTSLERVHLNANITGIGQNAFSGCTSLRRIAMSDSVSYIGDRAFYNCKKLDNLDLPAALDSIGERVFEGCASLSDVTVPEKVAEIREYAFAGCSSLTEVIWPDTVAFIGEGAFKDCSSLMSINIPMSVTAIEKYTFENCAELTLVVVSADVRSIGERAFAGCSSLQGVALPNALERIEREAFAECASLYAFALPSSVRELGAGILKGCTSIDSITVHFMSESYDDNRLSGNVGYLFDSENADNSLTPDSLKTVNLVDVAVITEGAFTDCTSIYAVNLSQSLTTIEAHAFKNSGVVRIVIPESVTVIKQGTFENCERLSNLTLPRHLVAIEDNAFSGCSSLTSVRLYNSLESIGAEAFYGCSSLVSLEVPKSVKTVGRSFIEGCTSLGTLVVPFVGSARDKSDAMNYILGDSEYDSLKKISVTDSHQIPDGAFRDLSSVEEIILPKEMYTVGDYAFAGCASLKYIEIPGSVTYIGRYSLEGCESLEALTVPFVGVRRDEMTGITNLFNGNPSEALKTVTVTQADEIPGGCFEGCEYIEKIFIDTVVERIGAYAFSGCSSLSEITIPDTLESIGDFAFSGCNQLRSIVFPEKLTELSSYGVFHDCYKLFEIYNYSPAVTVIPGEGEEGSAGYYALNVYAQGEKRVVVSVDGYEFLKQNNGSEWYLINYAVDEEGGCAVPAEFAYNGEINARYYVPAYLFYLDETLVNLSLPSSVMGIGQHAFHGCVNLTTADISSTQIYGIENSLFEGCQALARMIIPSNVTNISDKAFKGCSSLERVEFPELITYIGREAFYNCSVLNWVKIREYVWEIGANAFYGCVSLDHVYNMSALQIEAGETSNGYVAYYALLVDNDQIIENLHVVEIGELIFKKSEDRWFLIGHNSTDGALEILPFTYQNKYVDSYTIINEAFAWDSTINKVVFSNAVKRIGYNAFEGCNSITDVDFTDSSTLTLSDINWVRTLPQLTSIGFPKTLDTFPTDFINGFNSLETVSFAGNTVITAIPSGAFKNVRSSLKSVVLPERVETIESSAFINCSALENITMPDSITTIGDRAFRYCRSLKSVYMPASLESIGEYAFEECAIENLTLGSKVISIGYSAFSNCSNLKSADLLLTGMSSLPDYSFNGCSALESIKLPEMLTSIGSYAFNGCSSLKSITLSGKLTSIGAYAFSECSALASLKTPSTLVSIGTGAFYNCDSLQSVSLNEGLATIGSEAFMQCDSLESITVPYTVHHISDHAFAESGLKSVTLRGCETIGSGAFVNCYNLTKVSLPSVITEIGDSAFASCSSLSQINLANRRYLRTIGGSAFISCTSLTKADLTNCSALQQISDNAFNSCTALKSVDLDGCTSLTGIGGSAFSGCNSLSELSLTHCTSLQSIGEFAFYECQALVGLNFSSCTNLNRIGSYAFFNCQNLKTVNFPSALTYLGSYSFANCISLNSVDLSVCQSLTSISSNAFEYCSSLEYLTLPSNITTIGSYAFYECSSLKPIRIPSSLRASNIGSNAFFGCVGLYELWCDAPRTDLVIGSTSNGYIAYYAIAIHYSYDESALSFYTLNQNGVTYEFAYDAEVSGGVGQRYLIGASNYNGSGVFQFPTTATYSYTVSRFLNDDVSFSSAYVPTCVRGFETKYLNMWGYPTVYYAGSYDALNISGRGYLYTYVNCKHESGNTWYNTSTDPLTSVCDTVEIETKDSTCTALGNIDVHCARCNELLYSYAEPMKEHVTAERVVVEPTCTASGEVEIYCTVCGTVTDRYYTSKLDHVLVETVHSEPTCTETGIMYVYCESCQGLISTKSIPMIPHSYDQNNKCEHCGRVATDAEIMLEESLSFETTSGYTFIKNGSGGYVSSNKGVNNSRSEMKFTASEDLTLSVVYSVSSESEYDCFYILINGNQFVCKSGIVNKLEAVMELKAGDVVTFKYTKDGSRNVNDDSATVHSIVITTNNQ